MPPAHPLTLSLLLTLPALASGPPHIASLLPAGAQRGLPTIFTFSGERLDSAQEILFYDPGISIAKLEVKDDKTLLAHAVLAPDCPLGEHRLRVRTASGLSDLLTLWVGALPVLDEAEPNSDFAAAQKVPLNSTIHGVITREDADYFAVECKAGDRLTAEIEGIRLGRTLFDPALAILDAKRFELAVSDDSPLLAQDPSASVVVPADGTYIVMVREASYGGSDACRYRLHIGSLPRPHALWPPAARPGEAIQLTFPGDPKPLPPLAFTAPAALGPAPIFAADNTLLAPSANPLLISALPIAADNQDPPPPAPIAFHGILKKPADNAAPIARFRFSAKAGQPLDLRILARRLRTPLDAVLDIFSAKGDHITGNDDAGGGPQGPGADPELRFTPPADGVYEARIRDFRNRGGDDLVFRLEIEPPKPRIALSLDRIDPRRPQFLQAIAVPKGSRFAVMLRAERKDCGGELTLDIPPLPAGLTAKPLPFPPDLPAVPLLLKAAADAAPAGALIDLRAKLNDLSGSFTQTMPLVLGPPNDTVYYQTTVDRLAVAVTEAAPFRVKLEQPAAPVLRLGGRTLKVTVERDESFKGDVAVQMLWNPPGVSSAPAVNLPPNQASADYTVNIAGDAPLKTWKIAVLAHASVGGGDAWISSDFIDLAVADTFESGKIEMAAAERGKPASVLLKLSPTRPFEGKAKLTLIGLPPKTHAEPREIAAGETEAVFAVTTEPDAPVGQHRGLFVELELPQGPETVKHRLAFDGILRIDSPPPPTPAAAPDKPAPPPPPPPPANAPPPKPLSRLEQLRKQNEPKPEPKPDAPK